MTKTSRVWANRHDHGASRLQTRASSGGIVTAEGGGFIPTLDLGGGAVISPASGTDPS
jgi:hypothetical protein